MIPDTNSSKLGVNTLSSKHQEENLHDAVGWSTKWAQVYTILHVVLLQLGQNVLPVRVLPQGSNMRPNLNKQATINIAASIYSASTAQRQYKGNLGRKYRNAYAKKYNWSGLIFHLVHYYLALCRLSNVNHFLHNVVGVLVLHHSV